MQVGGHEYIHLRVYEPFAPQPELQGLESGKTKDDPLGYMDTN